MATEITERGYEDFRALAADNWRELSVRSAGVELFRLSIPNDRRVLEVVEPPYVRYQVRLAASDLEIEPLLPVTIDEIALHDGDTGEMVSPGRIEPFRFEDPADAVTITHSVKIPSEVLEGPPGAPGPPGRDGHSVQVFPQHDDPRAKAAPGDFWIELP